MEAPESRRPYAAALSPLIPRARAFAWKMPGIILYVEPLPSPLRTNRATNPTRKTGSEDLCEANTTTPVAAAIATKVPRVIRAPPNRSASAPPTGRISEPSSGPTKVSEAAWSGVRPNWVCRTSPKAKL